MHYERIEWDWIWCTIHITHIAKQNGPFFIILYLPVDFASFFTFIHYFNALQYPSYFIRCMYIRCRIFSLQTVTAVYTFFFLIFFPDSLLLSGYTLKRASLFSVNQIPILIPLANQKNKNTENPAYSVHSTKFDEKTIANKIEYNIT